MKYDVDYKIIMLFGVIFFSIILLPLVLNRAAKNHHGGFFEKYYLADRSVSGIVLAITLMSTYGSASTFLGGPGVAYKLGYGWVLLAVIQVVTGYFVLLVLAKKFKAAAQKINAITISEYLKNRYKSKVVAYLSTLAMIIFLIAAMSAQWVGGAKLLAAFMGINYKTGIVIISIIIIFCVVFGGLKNILITDMIQGLIMIFSTIILLYSVISYGGGIENITNNLLNINEKILTPFGANGSLTPSYVSSFWVLVGVGVIGIPQIAINSMLYKNKKSLKQSIIIGSIVIFIVMFGVHLIGVMARGVFPDIKDYDSVIPIITLKVLPWHLAALVLAAPMAAIITTVNAQFLLISSALIKDVLFSTKVIKEKIVGRKIPIFVYSINILVIILIMFISMRPPSLIVNVNLFAFGGLESTFLWPILLGLYWKGAEKYGAISSILVGLTSYIVFKNIYVIKAIEPVVISLMLSLIVFVFVSSIKRKKI